MKISGPYQPWIFLTVQESSGFVSNHPLDTELSLGARRSDKDGRKQLLF